MTPVLSTANAERRADLAGACLHLWPITILQRPFPIRAPIALTNGARDTNQKGMGMTEQPYDAAQEREEIAARVASFKATQEKFKREREEYFVTTLENARSKSERPPFWS
jgi:hypothetical protein